MTASQEEHMSKVGGILGIIGGIFGIIAAIATLFMGGLGAALEADGAKQMIGFGWGGAPFSFGSIVFGAVAFAKPKGAGVGLIVTSLAGAVLGGTRFRFWQVAPAMVRARLMDADEGFRIDADSRIEGRAKMDSAIKEWHRTGKIGWWAGPLITGAC
jgi:hypothetical protein